MGFILHGLFFLLFTSIPANMASIGHCSVALSSCLLQCLCVAPLSPVWIWVTKEPDTLDHILANGGSLLKCFQCHAENSLKQCCTVLFCGFGSCFLLNIWTDASAAAQVLCCNLNVNHYHQNDTREIKINLSLQHKHWKLMLCSTSAQAASQLVMVM